VRRQEDAVRVRTTNAAASSSTANRYISKLCFTAICPKSPVSVTQPASNSAIAVPTIETTVRVSLQFFVAFYSHKLNS